MSILNNQIKNMDVNKYRKESQSKSNSGIMSSMQANE